MYENLLVSPVFREPHNLLRKVYTPIYRLFISTMELKSKITLRIKQNKHNLNRFFVSMLIEKRTGI